MIEKIKKIGTQVLTVLIISVIVQIEQRKRDKKKSQSRCSYLLATLETTSRVLMAAAEAVHKNLNLMCKHERRNDL